MNERPVALVTGAGRGIGRASAIELARRGYRVALSARTAEQLEQTARMISTASLVLPGDVADPGMCQQIVTQTVGKFGRLDAVVHSAGRAPVASVEQMTPQMWRGVIDVNLSAAFYLARAVWGIFTQQGGGVLVNISSFAARDPFAGFAAYGAAKAGLNLLGLSLSREGAALGIRVHTIAPAAVETAMFREIMSEEQFPADKTLRPEEVADVAAQCVVGGSLRYTSGEVIWLQKQR